jgi:hypothetical protein
MDKITAKQLANALAADLVEEIKEHCGNPPDPLKVSEHIIYRMAALEAQREVDTKYFRELQNGINRVHTIIHNVAEVADQQFERIRTAHNRTTEMLNAVVNLFRR